MVGPSPTKAKKPAQIIGGHAYYCEWDPVLDPESGDTYYVNKYTEETTWDKPRELTLFEKQIHAAKEIQKTARGRQGRARVQNIKQEKRGHIVDKCDWEAVVDPSSRDTYYYNTKTQDTTWDKPPAFVKWEKQQNASTAVQSIQRGRQTRAQVSKNKGALRRQRQREARTRLHSRYPVSDSWETIVDEKSGKTYYLNKATNDTSWDKPEEMDNYEKHTSASTQIQSRTRIKQARNVRKSKYMQLLRKRIAQKCGGLEGLQNLFEKLSGGEGLDVDGVVSKEEFRAGVIEHLKIEVRKEEDLDDLFVALDVDESGRLDFEELEQIVKFDLRAEKAKTDFGSKCVWEEVLDKTSGESYYSNTVTGETTWDKPAAFIEFAKYRDAASRIQRCVRRRWAWREWRELIKAATVIGRHARRKMEARGRERKALEQERASVQMQKIARGRSARQAMAAKRRKHYEIRRRQRLPGVKKGSEVEGDEGIRATAHGGVHRPTPPNDPRAQQHQRQQHQPHQQHGRRHGNQTEQPLHSKLDESTRQHHLDAIPAYAARLTAVEIQRLSVEEIGQRIGLQPDRHSAQRIILVVGELARVGGERAKGAADHGSAFGIGRQGPAGRRDSSNAKAIQRGINRSRRLSSLYQRGVVRAARHTDALVMDSGLTTGLAASSAMSDGHNPNSVYKQRPDNNEEEVVLLGVSPAAAPGSGAALHKYHSRQLVLEDVFHRGAELEMKAELVTKLAGGCKVVVVAVNDGPTIRDELRILIEYQQKYQPSGQWPVVALQGSGGFVDTLANVCEACARGEPHQAHQTEDEAIARRLIDTDSIFVFPADGTPSELASFLHVLLTVSVR
jgi:hypothetical protein